MTDDGAEQLRRPLRPIERPDRSQCSSTEGREDDSDPARTAMGSALQWGTPDLIVFAIAKDAVRGWMRALEWELGRSRVPGKAGRGRRPLQKVEESSQS